jgi:hypothetical protein
MEIVVILVVLPPALVQGSDRTTCLDSRRFAWTTGQRARPTVVPDADVRTADPLYFVGDPDACKSVGSTAEFD